DADAVDEVLADEEPLEVRRSPARHGEAASGLCSALERLDGARRGWVQICVPAFRERDELVDHLRRPVALEMSRRAFGRLILGHGGVKVADLIGHTHEFVDLARRHAAQPPLCSSRSLKKLSALSARATAISETP